MPHFRSAIDSGVKYLDVCDDSAYGAKAKALNEKAKNANISAITCAGIYPGVSNLMALDTAETMKAEFRGMKQTRVKNPKLSTFCTTISRLGQEASGQPYWRRVSYFVAKTWCSGRTGNAWN